MDKKDEIISMQLDLIRQMTENNIRRLSDDIWGKDSSKINSNRTMEFSKKEETGERTSNSKDISFDPAKSSKDCSGSDFKLCDDKSEPEKVEDLMKELDSYIGLKSVKDEVRNLVNMAKVYKLRRDNGLPVTNISLHIVFSGNPGTGKTMIARFMARVYRSIGILSKGQLIETDRGGLVAGYIGQTAIKTASVLERALGGVLFIDEAYSLTNKSDNDFGYEAVDTILKFMEDHRDDIVIIAAGYTDLMEDFIDSNPGLRSRFNKYIYFEDYTSGEMTEIFKLQCDKGFYNPDEDAIKELNAYFNAVSEADGDFGNARGVRNIFEKILSEQANRLAAMESVSKDDLMRITATDVTAALYDKK